MKPISEYTIYCTEEQTKKALELGACLEEIAYPEQNEEYIQTDNYRLYRIPTAEQMIGFILESGRGYSTDLSELIREQGYKQGCLTFIDSCLK